ncbi:very short patch repair endonuclease [Gordonia iterans]|nr:very short patch repair endonuclease [Gordonia iterans]
MKSVEFEAPTPGRSRNMAAIKRKDTRPETALRSALHRQGMRFRKDLPIRTADRLVRPDIVFTRQKLAVFVDGCFWHSCPVHGRLPTTNTEYWTPKLATNARRDVAQRASLEAEGWTVLRLWEHEDPEEAASVVVVAINQLRENS